jgi:hypothetical protein
VWMHAGHKDARLFIVEGIVVDQRSSFIPADWQIGTI